MATGMYYVEKRYVYLIASDDPRILSQKMEEMRRDVFKNVENKASQI